MKFLLVSPFTSTCGSAIRFWNIALHLKQKGHDVVFIDRKSKNGESLYCSDQIKYHSCYSTGNQFVDIFVSVFFNILIFFKNIDCEVFYALKPAPNNCFPALISRLLGKKIILDVDDLDYAYLSGVNGRIFSFFFNLFPRFFPVITYHTPKLKRYLKTKAKIPENRLYYLAQGVSRQFFDVKVNEFVPYYKSIIYVATLGITSDFGDLIPMLELLCEKHPDIVMSIVGEGCRKQEFVQRVRVSGLENQIKFKGKLNHVELPEFISSHRIGINYMKPLEVNQCRAILKIREYLACGLEVVCNNVGDVELFKSNIYIEEDLDLIRKRLEILFLSKPSRNYDGRLEMEKRFQWNGIIDDFCEKIELI
ncbi:MAG TPA: glycosyltransferase [Chitinispirillaceae bacterium]|nr:glycosyltransferase [Chitinispirillaceae bacterium]